MPFEHLVERLQPSRSTAHAPLIQIIFTMDTNQSYSLELPDVSFETLENKETVAKFELALNAIKTEQGLSLSFDYNSDLFDSNTIETLGSHLISLLKGISVNPKVSCNALPMLSEQEQDYLLNTLNETKADSLKAQSIQQLFEQQVEQTPNSTALVFEGQTLSYNQLNQKANQMAHYLRSKGVKPETLVGLYTQRSFDMIIAILAILKAGGAYLPLDPSYPQSRLDFIINDSGIDLLLDYKALSVDDQPDNDLTPLTGQSLNNLAYVIYTSGSTGQPKGVMVEQGNLINAITGLSQQYQITEHSKVLQLISPAFDVSVSEIFMRLTNGAQLGLASESRLLPGDGLADVLFEYQITHLSIASAALAALPVRTDLALEVLIVGGEVSPQAQIDKWSEQARYFLAYGPTETTICSSTVEYTAGVKNTSIGRPIANVEYYVMQNSTTLAPFGAVGELYIGGAGVARGYLNRDELTFERFIQNPFKDGSRMYQTGDLVRYLPDLKESGQLEFIGRIDEQV
ncbi:MAG: amino acid adenylation domain-containing protein, partial [Psychrosphaera sp.]|nr:amino acid adenylation domain-containing protein [Psychrosphaera sp.]